MIWPTAERLKCLVYWEKGEEGREELLREKEDVEVLNRPLHKMQRNSVQR